MRAPGSFGSSFHALRARLAKSRQLRAVVRSLRSLQPDTRERQLRAEVRFWRRWLASGGLIWADDYAMRLDPNAVLQEPLASVVDRLGQPSVAILDVGAGPLTALGKVHPTSSIAITATDVLAPQYNALLDEFGIEPPVPTRAAAVETLVEQLGRRTFDIVHAQNSLDHSADAVAGLEQMLAMTRDGGFVVLFHEANEGLNEDYYALHKWDFDCDGGHFVIAGPGRDGARRDVSEMLSGRAEVECSTDGLMVLALIRKLPPS